MNRKTIIFTGGGSGGHVMPALTMIKKLQEAREFNVEYIGGINGIERELVKEYKLRYYPIHTGKLRRYISKENIKDILNIFKGFMESFQILKTFPANTLVFSTGGFVGVPVVLAAWLQRKKIYIHEQTSRVGLANKIASFFATKVFVSFEESLKFFPEKKTFFSGYPLREECYRSSINPVSIDGISLNEVSRPILFVTGGGNGSALLNKAIKNNLEDLLQEFFIVHQTGKHDFEEYRTLKSEFYHPMAFVGKEMIDLYKLSSVVVARSGAGTVCELMALGKKAIFIPLKIAQKNEQFHNAMEANQKLGSIVIQEDNLSKESLLAAIKQLSEDKTVQEGDKKNGLRHLINEVHKAF